MSECKRLGCEREGKIRAGYLGYCSLVCRDFDEYEQEIADLNAEVNLLTESNQALESKCDQLASGSLDIKAKYNKLLCAAKEVVGAEPGWLYSGECEEMHGRIKELESVLKEGE